MDARIEVRKNSDVTVDERVEITVPHAESSIVASLPKLRSNEDRQWTSTVQLQSVVADDVVRTTGIEDAGEERTVKVLESNKYPPGRHVLRIVYAASSLFVFIADGRSASPGHNYALKVDPLQVFGELRVGKDSPRWGDGRVNYLPVQAARVALIVPSDVPVNDVVVRSFTGGPETVYGPSRCDCTVSSSPSEHRITIETTRAIEPDDYLSIEMHFRPSSLAPDRGERQRLFAQDHSGLIAFGQWGAVLLLYIMLAAGLAACTGRSPWWRSHKRPVVFLLALLAGIFGVASVEVASHHALDLFHMGYPGLIAGVYLSLIIFPSPHGPAQEFLIVPIAIAFQALFYFGVGWFLFLLIRGRIKLFQRINEMRSSR